ncbi:MAG: hypothetical protein AB1641_22065, partial [Thermodesulfobacteriota bacterium]
PTPPRGDAVSLGYRPECECLERTCTSLFVCARRRTRGALRAPDLSDLIGVPFLDGGRDPAIGLDCWGLVMEVTSRVSRDRIVPDYGVSADDIANIRLVSAPIIAGTAEKSNWHRLPGPILGAVAALAISPYCPGVAQHFGVCLDEIRFIHTLKKTGAHVVRLDHLFWSRKIQGYFEWRAA